MPGKDEKSRSALSDIADDAQIDEWKQARTGAIALPAHVAGSGTENGGAKLGHGSGGIVLLRAV